jgi:hypothetical protein
MLMGPFQAGSGGVDQLIEGERVTGDVEPVGQWAVVKGGLRRIDGCVGSRGELHLLVAVAT